METVKTFILTNKRTWSRQVRVFVLNQNKKYEERQCLFTTERIVSSKQRTARGHSIAAEYTTNDPVIIEAMFRDTAYGKDFILKGDESGSLKKPSVVISETDRQLVAIRGLFNIAGLYMDETLPYDVLREQYEIHMNSKAGRAAESMVTQIPHVPVNVKATIEEGINAARQLYETKFGEPIPPVVENDLAFLDALADPKFDAKKYIEKKLAKSEETPDSGEEVEDSKPDLVNEKAELAKAYFEKFKKNVPTPKVNDLAWIKAKIEEQA